VPDGAQAMIGRELEDRHATELPLARLPCGIDDEIAIAHPRPAVAAEGDVRELAERLLLFRGLLQLRREKLADTDGNDHQNRPGHERRSGDTHRRDAGGANHRDLAAASERAESHERTEQRRDRQELPGLLRQIQQDVQNRVLRGVTADADVVLLPDEQKQRAQHQQQQRPHADGRENGADEIAIQRVHAGTASGATSR
jgi:hypothetical protein